MRLFSNVLLFVYVLVLGLPSYAQTNFPPAAKSVFARFMVLNNQGKLKTVSAKNLLIEEAKRFSEVDKLGQISAPDAFQLMDSRHAVARVQGLNGKTPVLDLYFYLTLDGAQWKISAMRSLSMTGMIEMAMDELQKKPKLSAKEREELTNMKLTLSLDSELRTYFQSHRAQFEQLRTMGAKKHADRESYVRKLGLSHVSSTDDSNLEFVIGGLVDNTVGYIYSPSNQPPKISPREYIWVEKIADKWYLFRTT